MVKRAILSDVHGNVEAFDVVLADIADRGIDEIYCLGDIIGYGPDPRGCIDRCLEFDLCILGNHDQGALFDPEGFSAGAERAIFWTRQQLEATDDDANEGRMKFLAERPRTRREDETLFVHGSARSPLTEYVFPEDVYNARKIEKIFGFIEKYCFQGHTHVPGIFHIDGKFLSPADLDSGYQLNGDKVMINVGSVGQPRDNDPRACYVVQTDSQLEFVRLDYPYDQTREKIYGIPELDNFLGDRLTEGR